MAAAKRTLLVLSLAALMVRVSPIAWAAGLPPHGPIGPVQVHVSGHSSRHHLPLATHHLGSIVAARTRAGGYSEILLLAVAWQTVTPAAASPRSRAPPVRRT